MATFSKLVFSGSSSGRAVKIDAITSPGTLIHTAASVSTSLDEVWLYAQNSSSSPVKLTVQWGGTSSPDDEIEISVSPESGLVLISPGLTLQGNATPLVVRAFASVANVVMLHGFVNRVSG